MNASELIHIVQRAGTVIAAEARYGKRLVYNSIDATTAGGYVGLGVAGVVASVALFAWVVRLARVRSRERANAIVVRVAAAAPVDDGDDHESEKYLGMRNAAPGICPCLIPHCLLLAVHLHGLLCVVGESDIDDDSQTPTARSGR